MKKNILDNPFFLFFIFITTVITNTISSVYFTSIMFAGFVFLAFIKCVQSRYYYSSFFITLTLLFIELNNGFAPFTLVLFSIFSYVFIIPRIKKVMSFSGLNYFLYVLWFYAGIIVIWYFTNNIDVTLIGTVFLNIIIDFILIGMFL
jgi:hypothetical protein